MRLWRNVHNHCIPTPENAYRPGALSRASLIAFLSFTLAVEGFLVAGLVARESDGSFLSAVIASDVVSFTNTQRHDAALGTLHENVLLDTAAQAKALDMASKGYFAHVAPDGTLPWTWIASSGYEYQYAGENLAVRFSNAQDVVAAWMASPTHRDNLLKPVYTDVGVGVAQGLYQGQPATYVVQFFATPAHPTLPVRDAAAVTLAQPVQSLIQSVNRFFMRLADDPIVVADWLLGGVAALLMVVVCLAFVVHVDVQPRDMLVGGTVVALVALTCVFANVHFLSDTSDSVAGAIHSFNMSDEWYASDHR